VCNQRVSSGPQDILGSSLQTGLRPVGSSFTILEEGRGAAAGCGSTATMSLASLLESSSYPVAIDCKRPPLPVALAVVSKSATHLLR